MNIFLSLAIVALPFFLWWWFCAFHAPTDDFFDDDSDDWEPESGHEP